MNITKVTHNWENIIRPRGLVQGKGAVIWNVAILTLFITIVDSSGIKPVLCQHRCYSTLRRVLAWNSSRNGRHNVVRQESRHIEVTSRILYDIVFNCLGLEL